MLMTTAEQLPARQSSLSGARILVVQTRPISSLGMGTAVVRRGGRANICRSSIAALDVLSDVSTSFDAAVLDGEMSRANLLRVSRALRERGKPCLAVGVASVSDDASVRRLVEAGVNELVIPPLTAHAVVEATARCVLETRRLREQVATAPRSMRRRSPPHWNQAAASRPVPRFNPDIEQAVDRYAERVRLTPREASVLKLIALGYIYDEIGEVLSIAGRTVKMHAANVRKKVGAPNRMALVRKVLSA